MKQKLFSIVGVLLLVGISLFPLAPLASAQSNEGVAAAEEKKKEEKILEQAGLSPEIYGSNSALKVGTVIQPEGSDAKKVKAATQKEIEKAFGVVVSTNNLPITISNNATEGQVYVATSGRQDALVTSENGPIKAGDFLALSSLSGTLMKSTEKSKLVFGKALEGFDGKNNLAGTRTLKDTKGKDLQKIGIGMIAVSIEIQKNPEEKSTKSRLPDVLQRVGQQIAEKPVSAIRIYISTAIVVFCIITAIVLLYVGVRSAVIAIGRNPLSKKSIFRALLEVILTSVLVLIIGLFTVYLVLRL